MGFLFSLFIVLIFWSFIYLINTFLIECKFTSAAYAKLLSKNGFSINILQIKWYTVRCNRLFIKISNWKPNFFRLWFNLGVIIGLVGQFCSILLLTYTLVDFFRYKPSSEQILVPVV
jgi:predicted MPP superfamily phosphohydrolase